jgi:DNA-binding NtrC family response regulator
MASLGRVLVVDDDPDVALVLRDLLDDFGYAVKIAVTGAEALGLIDVYKPDTVLLDLWLPVVPGDVVLQQIASRDPALPVIIVTGNRDIELARTVLAAAFDYIPKPFDSGVLERVVAAAIVERARRLGPSGDAS